MSSELPHTWKSESEPTPRVADIRQYDPQPCRSRVHLLQRPAPLVAASRASELDRVRVCIRVWAQALSRRGLWTRALSGNDMARPCIIAQIDHAKTVGGI